MPEQYCVVDGAVTLDPERHVIVCEGLAPLLGAVATQVTAQRLPNMQEGDGCFGWTERPDCVDHVLVLAASEDGKTVQTAFRWYEKDGNHYPWQSDSLDRGLSPDVVNLLADLATGEAGRNSFFDQLAATGGTEQTGQRPAGFVYMSATDFSAALERLKRQPAQRLTDIDISQELLAA